MQSSKLSAINEKYCAGKIVGGQIVFRNSGQRVTPSGHDLTQKKNLCKFSSLGWVKSKQPGRIHSSVFSFGVCWCVEHFGRTSSDDKGLIMAFLRCLGILSQGREFSATRKSAKSDFHLGKCVAHARD